MIRTPFGTIRRPKSETRPASSQAIPAPAPQADPEAAADSPADPQAAPAQAGEEPADPAGEEPADPAGEEPADPAGEAPADPAGDAPETAPEAAGRAAGFLPARRRPHGGVQLRAVQPGRVRAQPGRRARAELPAGPRGPGHGQHPHLRPHAAQRPQIIAGNRPGDQRGLHGPPGGRLPHPSQPERPPASPAGASGRRARRGAGAAGGAPELRAGGRNVPAAHSLPVFGRRHHLPPGLQLSDPLRNPRQSGQAAGADPGLRRRGLRRQAGAHLSPGAQPGHRPGPGAGRHLRRSGRGRSLSHSLSSHRPAELAAGHRLRRGRLRRGGPLGGPSGPGRPEPGRSATTSSRSRMATPWPLPGCC